MTAKRSHTSPPRDLPREELMRQADKFMIEFGDLAEIYFKFTCEACGERCTLVEANKLYEKGICHVCEHETEIKKGGFMLQMKLGL